MGSRWTVRGRLFLYSKRICANRVMVHQQERLLNESPLAYKYYLLYRDQEPSTRSLRSLCDIEVAGKKRTLRQIGAWSSQQDWTHRVAVWDAETEREAQLRKFTERVQALEHYIDTELAFIGEIQQLLQKALQNLKQADTPELQLSEIVKTWSQVRVWLQESIALAEWMEEKQNDEKDPQKNNG